MTVFQKDDIKMKGKGLGEKLLSFWHLSHPTDKRNQELFLYNGFSNKENTLAYLFGKVFLWKYLVVGVGVASITYVG